MLAGLMFILATEAATPEVWAALHNGHLAAANHDHAQAIAIYEAVLAHLPHEDPIRGELLYWLGRANYEMGEYDTAKLALDQAITASPSHREAIKLIALLELWQTPILSLPHTSSTEISIPPNTTWRLAFGDGLGAVTTIELTLISEQPYRVRAQATDHSGIKWRNESQTLAPMEPGVSRLTFSTADFLPMSRATVPLNTIPLWTFSLQSLGESPADLIISEVHIH